MPTFMDRHEFEGVTPEDAAAAHVQDLRLQASHNVRFLTYWFDEGRGLGFCLAEAPDQDSVVSVHREAHGAVPHAIFEVDAHAVMSFLGAINDPEPGTPWAMSAFRAILFTDIVGSTSLIGSLGDVGAKNLVMEQDRLVKAEFARYGATVAEHTGDGVMGSFPSARDAVRCAIGIQRSMGSREPDHPPLQVRVGIAAGEPIQEDGRLFGAAVNLAARICAACDPDAIWVAGGVRELALGKGFTFLDRGEVSLKGFDEPSRLYEVAWSG